MSEPFTTACPCGQAGCSRERAEFEAVTMLAGSYTGLSLSIAVPGKWTSISKADALRLKQWIEDNFGEEEG